MNLRTRNNRGDSDAEGYQDYITIEVTKGAGGTRTTPEKREALRGLTHRQVIQHVLRSLGPGDSFAQDAAQALADRGFSVERVDSGSQTHWVDRDAPVDETILAQEQLRYAMSRDHVGGS